MGAAELIALAASTSLLAGWRLYLVTLVTGLGMRFGWIALPEHLQALEALASWWVIGAAGVGTFAEFFADKIAWVDSLWDSIHSFIRPLGGALLSLAIVDSADPAWQIASFLLGGGAAALAHAGKAGARAMVNASPNLQQHRRVERGGHRHRRSPRARHANPVAAALVAAILVILSLWLVLSARRMLRRMIDRLNPPRAPG